MVRREGDRARYFYHWATKEVSNKVIKNADRGLHFALHAALLTQSGIHSALVAQHE
jgi:hypothetical protein